MNLADVGMTDQHKQILLSNFENLQQMNLDKVAKQLHSCGLLDDTERQNLLSDTRQPSQRIDMLLSEILPRKGPKAFEDFARELEKVHPKIARKLLEAPGMRGTIHHYIILSIFSQSSKMFLSHFECCGSLFHWWFSSFLLSFILGMDMCG